MRKSVSKFLPGLITAMILVLSPCTTGDGQSNTSHSSTSITPAALLEDYGKLPLAFEANQGQSDSRVKFILRGSGYSLFLTAVEAVLSLRAGNAAENKEFSKTGPRSAALRKPGELHHRFGKVRGDHGKETNLRISLVGANFAASPAGLEELPGKLNYFLGSDRSKWRTDVPTFAKVRYKSVYPGVDLIYHGDHRELEYDFIVAPGAAPNVIRMSFGGLAGEKSAVIPKVESDGNLLLRTSAGDVEMRSPFAYQQIGNERQEVSSRYALQSKDQVGFRLGAYDRNRPLIIDPVLAYSTYLGGDDIDSAAGIAVDASGSAYIVGGTISDNFPTTLGTMQGLPAGQGDVFITKLSADGESLIYSTYLGGSLPDYGSGIAVDSEGSAYITGVTYSNDFPTTTGAFQTLNKGGDNYLTNAFVAKIATDGKSLAYSTYLGGSGDVVNGFGDSSSSIAVDPAGSAYVTGTTSSSDFPTTPGAFQTAYLAIINTAFVTKLAPDGKSLVYSTYLGGDGSDTAYGIATDSALNAYVTGTTTSPLFPTTPGAFQPSLISVENAFVSKLAPDGKSLVYSTLFGGRGSFFSGDYDVGTSIAVDSTLNAYVTGFTSSATFPTKSAFQGTYGGGAENGFLTKFNPAGSALLYSTYLGGSGDDEGLGIALDSSGDVNMAGGAGSSDFPIVNAVQSVCGDCLEGGADAFVAKFDTTQSGASSLLFSSFLGGTSFDYGRAIAVDGLGNIYVTGRTDGGFPITAGAMQASPGGISCVNDTCDPVVDGFVAKIAPNPAPAFTLTQARLDFGNLGIATSASLTAIVGNSGTAPLSMSAITLTGGNSGEFSESDTCGASIGAGGSCTVMVRFSPVTTGAKTAVITFTFDAPGGSQAMGLFGVGVIPAPALTLQLTSFDFGNIAVGSTKWSGGIQYTNTGNVPVTISSVTLTGPNSGDFVLSLAGLVTELKPGDIGFVGATFEPTVVGNRSGTIMITDTSSTAQNNDPGSPHALALTGVGVAAPDFTIAASPNTATVTAGQTKSYAVTLTPIGGFAGTVSLACTGAPSLATCAVPMPLALDGVNPITTTVTLTTTARSIVAPPRSFPRFWPRGFAARWLFIWLFIVLCLMMAMLGTKAARPANQRLAAMCFAAVLLFAFLCVTGCNNSIGGGNGGSPGTPSGSYTLTIAAASSGLSHHTTVAIVVN